jgi:perosamine synthetase
MKIDDVEKAITKKTKAIIAVHIYGYPLDMERLLKLSRRNKIFLIEDAAEMIGNKFKKNYCGFYGDISTFSFYVNKHITTGEGGMILTNNKKIYEESIKLKNLYFGKGTNRFKHNDIGWNQRFTNLQAAIGLAQLERIGKIVQKKKVNIKKFKKKGYSRPTLKNFNKFFLFNHIKNIRFNSAKKKIAKKVDFKNKYNNIKKIKLKK